MLHLSGKRKKGFKECKNNNNFNFFSDNRNNNKNNNNKNNNNNNKRNIKKILNYIYLAFEYILLAGKSASHAAGAIYRNKDIT